MRKKPKRRRKYSYVEFVDKRKLKYDSYDDNIEPEIRKPTPPEREEIILNFIRTNSNKKVRHKPDKTIRHTDLPHMPFAFINIDSRNKRQKRIRLLMETGSPLTYLVTRTGIEPMFSA